MDVNPLWLKAFMLLVLAAYLGFLIRNRENFNVGSNMLLSAISFSFALSLGLSLIRENGMNMSYAGLIFSSLTFGWIGGIAGSFGIAVAAYSMGANLQEVVLCLVLCSSASAVAGGLAKRGPEFSTLLVGSVLAGITILGGSYAYLMIKGATDIPTILAPKTVSIVTGVVLGTGTAFYVKKLEDWPEPIERKK